MLDGPGSDKQRLELVDLPPEIHLLLFQHLASLDDVSNLSLVSHQFVDIYREHKIAICRSIITLSPFHALDVPLCRLIAANDESNGERRCFTNYIDMRATPKDMNKEDIPLIARRWVLVSQLCQLYEDAGVRARYSKVPFPQKGPTWAYTLIRQKTFVVPDHWPVSSQAGDTDAKERFYYATTRIWTSVEWKRLRDKSNYPTQNFQNDAYDDVWAIWSASDCHIWQIADIMEVYNFLYRFIGSKIFSSIIGPQEWRPPADANRHAWALRLQRSLNQWDRDVDSLSSFLRPSDIHHLLRVMRDGGDLEQERQRHINLTHWIERGSRVEIIDSDESPDIYLGLEHIEDMLKSKVAQQEKRLESRGNRISLADTFTCFRNAWPETARFQCLNWPTDDSYLLQQLEEFAPRHAFVTAFSSMTL